MFSFLTRYVKSGNQQFAVELTKWTFHERGHLKVSVSLHKYGDFTRLSLFYRSSSLSSDLLLVYLSRVF